MVREEPEGKNPVGETELTMTQPSRIACIAVIQVTQILAVAITIMAAAETMNWAMMWWEARHG